MIRFRRCFFFLLCYLEMHACLLRTAMEVTPALRKGPGMYFEPKEFGKRMKEAKNRKGLTQERLAEMLGVDRLHVNRLEKGAKACSIDLLIDISQLLDVSTDYLLKGTPIISSDARVIAALRRRSLYPAELRGLMRLELIFTSSDKN